MIRQMRRRLPSFVKIERSGDAIWMSFNYSVAMLYQTSKSPPDEIVLAGLSDAKITADAARLAFSEPPVLVMLRDFYDGEKTLELDKLFMGGHNGNTFFYDTKRKSTAVPAGTFTTDKPGA
jgi:hypothetical protein